MHGVTKCCAIALVFTAACSPDDRPPADAAAIDASIDGNTYFDAPYSCEPSGACSEGPACGSSCCGAGEHCENGTCKCGDGAACDTANTGNTCQSGGPIAPSFCGYICCGGTMGCPI